MTDRFVHGRRSMANKPDHRRRWVDSSDMGVTSPGRLTEQPVRRRTGHRSSQRAVWLMRSAVLALVLTNFLLIAHDRSSILEQVRVHNTNLARAVSERMEASIAEIDHVLSAIVDQMASSESTRADPATLEPALATAVSRIDQLDGLFLYDASGLQVATSEPLQDKANAADMPYFRFHRDHAGSSALLGRPSINPLLPSRWTLPLSRRINDTQGRFAGVALAAISIDHFRRMLDRFDIGEGSITLVVSGHHLVRRPFRPEDIGKPIPPAPGVSEQDDSGSGNAQSPVDGIDWLFSYENNRSYPVRVVVAANRSEALHDWWIASALQTLWVGLLCFVLLRSATHSRRALRHRQEAERSLRKAHASLADANERLQRLAQFDELTSLPNRRYFDKRLQRTFKSAQRDSQWLAIVMVDIDLFKTYNDRFGHPRGDQCLKTVSAALRAAVGRPHDFVARYGGEEMVMLLPGADPQGARAVAESAREAVLHANIAHPDNPLGRVTVSLGVAAEIPDKTRDPAKLLQSADDALYAAKRAGRNRVEVSA